MFYYLVGGIPTPGWWDLLTMEHGKTIGIHVLLPGWWYTYPWLVGSFNDGTWENHRNPRFTTWLVVYLPL